MKMKNFQIFKLPSNNFFRTKNGMRRCHTWVNTNKNRHVNLLPITNIERVIGDNDFSLLLNVLFRFLIKMFSQNKITEIHTNTSLMLDVVILFTTEETNVCILKLSTNKKKSKKVKHKSSNIMENDIPSRGKVLSITCMIFMCATFQTKRVFYIMKTISRYFFLEILNSYRLCSYYDL